jgi:hypothetical protein
MTLPGARTVCAALGKTPWRMSLLVLVRSIQKGASISKRELTKIWQERRIWLWGWNLTLYILLSVCRHCWVSDILVFFWMRCWQASVLEFLPQHFPPHFLISTMTMIISRETFAPIIAWSWSIAYKTVALHLRKQKMKSHLNKCCLVTTCVIIL